MSCTITAVIAVDFTLDSTILFGLCGLGIWFLFVLSGRPFGLCSGGLWLLVALAVSLFNLCGVGLGLELTWAFGVALFILFSVGLGLPFVIRGQGHFFIATSWI